MSNNGDLYLKALDDFTNHCYAILACNFTKNTFEVIKLSEEYDKGIHYELSLSDFLDYSCKMGIIYEEDVKDYQKYTNIDFLRQFFKETHGEVDHWVRYRSTYNRDDYRWLRIEFIVASDYTDDNQTGYIFIKDVHTPIVERKLLFEDLLRELSENYENIYYVDFDEDVVYVNRISPVIDEKFGPFFRSKPPYDLAIKGYISNEVVKRDQKDMFRVCEKSFLKEQLAKRASFSREYRVEREGREYFYHMKVCNMDGAGELHRAVFGFTDVSEEKYLKPDFYEIGSQILVVEDDAVSRQLLKDILKDKYQVIVTENGEEAMKVLDEQFEDIALVITDLEMPVCDGYELLERIQRVRQYRSIPVIVSSSNDTEETEIRCFELGAADFVAKPYNPTIILNRVKRLINLRESTAMINVVEKDKITQLYTHEVFQKYAQSILNNNPDVEYNIIISDIEHFKVINDRYGTENANAVLAQFAENGLRIIPGLVIAGRYNGDQFAWLQRADCYNSGDDMRLAEEMLCGITIPNVVAKYGFYHIGTDRSHAITTYCDRASVAVEKIKHKYKVYAAEYDNKMHEDREVAQQIIDNMEEALTGNQFEVYYQPKHELETDHVAGAEALVRWIHPELGFMNPGAFIPIFEQNGFIARLDQYVLERVCQDIKEWEKTYGFTVPVSFNVSRGDFDFEMLDESIINIVDSYDVAHELIHIEITESAYSDNPDRIVRTIRKLHDANFKIELDDFGTGYSSLTALNSMDIDILKLDRSIIKADTESSERSVMEFSMQLAKMLDIRVVQEGVETSEQLNRVKNLGCDFVQGFYYAKPMPVNDFIKYCREDANKHN